MKKILSAIIILLVLFNTFGFELIFSIALSECKNEAISVIKSLEEENNLKVLHISKKNIKNVIRLNDKEIQINGELFDVFKEEEIGSEVVFYCYHDEKEQRLINDFHRSEKKEQSTTKENEARFVLKNLVKNYINPEDIIINESNELEKIIIFSVPFYNSPELNIIPHPPQLLSC